MTVKARRELIIPSEILIIQLSHNVLFLSELVGKHVDGPKAICVTVGSDDELD